MRTSKIAFITLGCAKNEVDTDHMRALLREAGYEITDAMPYADAVVVNTCSFIREATEQSIDAILDLVEDNHSLKDTVKVIVTGCMPSRYGGELEQELTEVSAFVTCEEEDKIVEVVDEVLGQSSDLRRALSSLAQSDEQPREYEGEFEADPTSSHLDFAYIKISEGCSNNCSYCTIPQIRGKHRSFLLEDIMAEIEKKHASGCREVVLIAQDTGVWGCDLQPPLTLAHLMKTIAEAYPDLWIRVMYVQPQGVNDELLDVMNSYDNVCSYLDIPLQHCKKNLLTSMNRRGGEKEFLELIDHIRSKVPGIALRTTLIVGYPGETHDDFQDLLSFVEKARFDYVGVFQYSPEEGTHAADLPHQVPDEVKLNRAQILRNTCDEVSQEVILRYIDCDAEVLICGYEDDALWGRTQFQAPEVDGITFVDQGSVGSRGRYHIDSTTLYDLEGRKIIE